ncbi:MAG: butyrate kinase [Syntrophales bacterium]|jgi:butyrate kinase|nr:butyrate kinase [Syntrophales bacterium]MCK9392207.1 butyrate kinase [Syntrophales bacterium]
MADEHRLLIMNVGSTSTKVAFFKESRQIALENIRYSGEELAAYATLAEQLPRREGDVLTFTGSNGIDLKAVDMVVSRGGLGKPAPAGAYRIDDAMCRDLMEGRYGKHPSALGPAMALSFSRQFGMPAIVIDAPSTDEFEPLARISGLPEIERKSVFHALNQKAAARRLAKDLGKRYEEINVVVAHLGGGITIGAHRQGRVIDCTHGLSEGPFTPERAGSLPTMDLLDLTWSEKLEKKAIQGRLIGQGGMAAYLATTDAQKVEGMIKGGSEQAMLIYNAMAYQVAKDIGAMATVLKGDLEAVVLTGGLAHSKLLMELIEERVRFLAPVSVYPGEDEMPALAEGGLRVLSKEEEIKEYR